MHNNVRATRRHVGGVAIAIAVAGVLGWESAGVGTATAQSTSIPLPSDNAKGYITFAINTHDWLHVDQSADVLLRLVDLYEKHGVRGDFYLTSPMTHYYAGSRPDVIRRLRESKMTISYHIRPPHILYPKFNGRLGGLDDDQLAKTLRDYETYRLDMATGELLRDQPGGYQYVAETFGRKPVALGLPTGSPRERTAARRNYRELGARVVVEHHESGTKLDVPFEWADDLVMRPSDFSITRWLLPGMPGRETFWWNMLLTPRAAEYNPTAYLQKRLAEWNGPRPPLVTCLIHENNFYRARATPFALIYYTDTRKTRPRTPPFDLKGPDASIARSAEDRQAIWEAYEALVAYAAANLEVVTSEDIVKMAEAAREPVARDRPYMQFNSYRKCNYPVWTLMEILYVMGKLTPAQAQFAGPRSPPITGGTESRLPVAGSKSWQSWGHLRLHGIGKPLTFDVTRYDMFSRRSKVSRWLLNRAWTYAP